MNRETSEGAQRPLMTYSVVRTARILMLCARNDQCYFSSWGDAAPHKRVADAICRLLR
ncbi:hypothetical protein PSEUDO8O_160013 [Pseudomonas sp. 8O]|nr:hypothetical protein PSEUDO8O_160013 [Pseudomonas sp. 8O]